jgi:hypothetical protein
MVRVRTEGIRFTESTLHYSAYRRNGNWHERDGGKSEVRVQRSEVRGQIENEHPAQAELGRGTRRPQKKKQVIRFSLDDKPG